MGTNAPNSIKASEAYFSLPDIADISGRRLVVLKNQWYAQVFVAKKTELNRVFFLCDDTNGLTVSIHKAVKITTNGIDSFSPGQLVNEITHVVDAENPFQELATDSSSALGKWYYPDWKATPQTPDVGNEYIVIFKTDSETKTPSIFFSLDYRSSIFPQIITWNGINWSNNGVPTPSSGILKTGSLCFGIVGIEVSETSIFDSGNVVIGGRKTGSRGYPVFMYVENISSQTNKIVIDFSLLPTGIAIDGVAEETDQAMMSWYYFSEAKLPTSDNFNLNKVSFHPELDNVKNFVIYMQPDRLAPIPKAFQVENDFNLYASPVGLVPLYESNFSFTGRADGTNKNFINDTTGRFGSNFWSHFRSEKEKTNTIGTPSKRDSFNSKNPSFVDFSVENPNKDIDVLKRLTLTNDILTTGNEDRQITRGFTHVVFFKDHYIFFSQQTQFFGAGNLRIYIADSGLTTWTIGTINVIDSSPSTQEGSFPMGIYGVHDVIVRNLDGVETILVLFKTTRSTNPADANSPAFFDLGYYQGSATTITHNYQLVPITAENGSFNQDGQDAQIESKIVSNPVFTGTGFYDGMIPGSDGTFNYRAPIVYTITAVTGSTFSWSNDLAESAGSAGMTGAPQALSKGIEVTFTPSSGHTIGDKWVFTAGGKDSNESELQRARFITPNNGSSIYVTARNTQFGLPIWKIDMLLPASNMDVAGPPQVRPNHETLNSNRGIADRNDVWVSNVMYDGSTTYLGCETVEQGINPPTAAPVISSLSGTGITGRYSYKISFVSGSGEESSASPASVSTVPSNQTVTLDSIPISPNPDTISRNIYRTSAGGSIHRFLATISDNVTTSFADNNVDGVLSFVLTAPTKNETVKKGFATVYRTHDFITFEQLIGGKSFDPPSWMTGFVTPNINNEVTFMHKVGSILHVWVSPSLLEDENIGLPVAPLTNKYSKQNTSLHIAVDINSRVVKILRKFPIEDEQGDPAYSTKPTISDLQFGPRSKALKTIDGGAVNGHKIYIYGADGVTLSNFEPEDYGTRWLVYDDRVINHAFERYNDSSFFDTTKTEISLSYRGSSDLNGATLDPTNTETAWTNSTGGVGRIDQATIFEIKPKFSSGKQFILYDQSLNLFTLNEEILGNSSNAIATITDIQGVISATGLSSTWDVETNMPDEKTQYSSVTNPDTSILYAIGGTRNGFSPSGQSDPSIVYARPGVGGDITEWKTTTRPLDIGLTGASSQIFNGFLYVTGGTPNQSGSVEVNVVKHVPIDTGGDITTTWTTDSPLPTTVFRHSSAIYQGTSANYIYAIGGQDGGGGVTDVSMNEINNDGNLNGAWSALTVLPQTRWGHESVVVGNFIYVVGGFQAPSTVLDSVIFATINPLDGTIGTWTATSSLPLATAFHSLGVLNGFMYVFGGTEDGTIQRSTIYLARINNNGTLGAWTASTNSLPFDVFHIGSAFVGQYVYILGGFSNGLSLSSVLKNSVFEESTGLLELENVAGIFLDNEEISGDNGGLATINGTLGNVHLQYVSETNGPFTVGASITGSVSTESGTLVCLDDDGTNGVMVFSMTTPFVLTDTLNEDTSSASADVFANAGITIGTLVEAIVVDPLQWIDSEGNIGEGNAGTLMPLRNGISITITDLTGHTADDVWTVVVAPAARKGFPLYPGRGVYHGKTIGCLDHDETHPMFDDYPRLSPDSTNAFTKPRAIIYCGAVNYAGDENDGIEYDSKNIPSSMISQNGVAYLITNNDVNGLRVYKDYGVKQLPENWGDPGYSGSENVNDYTFLDIDKASFELAVGGTNTFGVKARRTKTMIANGLVFIGELKEDVIANTFGSIHENFPDRNLLVLTNGLNRAQMIKGYYRINYIGDIDALANEADILKLADPSVSETELVIKAAQTWEALFEDLDDVITIPLAQNVSNAISDRVFFRHIFPTDIDANFFRIEAPNLLASTTEPKVEVMVKGLGLCDVNLGGSRENKLQKKICISGIVLNEHDDPTDILGGGVDLPGGGEIIIDIPKPIYISEISFKAIPLERSFSNADESDFEFYILPKFSKDTFGKKPIAPQDWVPIGDPFRYSFSGNGGQIKKDNIKVYARSIKIVWNSGVSVCLTDLKIKGTTSVHMGPVSYVPVVMNPLLVVQWPNLNDLSVNNTYTGISNLTYRVEIDRSGYDKTFNGSGQDDLFMGGEFNGNPFTFNIEIDNSLSSPNTFRWSTNGGSTWVAENVNITGDGQVLTNGAIIRFSGTFGHTASESWTVIQAGDTFKWSDDNGVTYAKQGIEINEEAQALSNGVEITFASKFNHTVDNSINGDSWTFVRNIIDQFNFNDGVTTPEFILVDDVRGFIDFQSSGTNTVAFASFNKSNAQLEIDLGDTVPATRLSMNAAGGGDSNRTIIVDIYDGSAWENIYTGTIVDYNYSIVNWRPKKKEKSKSMEITLLDSATMLDKLKLNPSLVSSANQSNHSALFNLNGMAGFSFRPNTEKDRSLSIKSSRDRNVLIETNPFDGVISMNAQMDEDGPFSSDVANGIRIISDAVKVSGSEKTLTTGGEYTGGENEAKYKIEIDGLDFSPVFFGDTTSNMTVTDQGYSGPPARYRVEIDSTFPENESVSEADTFKWSFDGGKTFKSENVIITGTSQTLTTGIDINFATITGNELGSFYDFNTTDTFRWSDDEGVTFKESEQLIRISKNMPLNNGVTIKFSDANGHVLNTANSGWTFSADKTLVGIIENNLNIDFSMRNIRKIRILLKNQNVGDSSVRINGLKVFSPLVGSDGLFQTPTTKAVWNVRLQSHVAE